MPPENFEKLYSLRLNLRAFLVIHHPLMLLWAQVHKTSYNLAISYLHTYIHAIIPLVVGVPVSIFKY